MQSLSLVMIGNTAAGATSVPSPVVKVVVRATAAGSLENKPNEHFLVAGLPFLYPNHLMQVHARLRIQRHHPHI